MVRGFDLDPKPKKRKFLDYNRLPTGVFPVDYMVAGGVPFNVIAQYYGPPNGGKNTLAVLTAKSLSRFCCECLSPAVFCDCTSGPTIQKTLWCHVGEGTPDSYWPAFLGYEAQGNLVLATPQYGEMACELMEQAVGRDDCGLVVLDSLAGLTSRRDLEESYEKGQTAEAPRLQSRFMRRMNNRLTIEYKRGHRVAVVVLNQVRTNFGVTFGSNETTAGGWASRHGFRLSLRVNQVSAKDDGQDKDSGLNNLLRFSTSVQGLQTKAQLLVMEAKSEYKVMSKTVDSYRAGFVFDVKTTIKKAKELGLLTKEQNRYKFFGQEFNRLTDIENLMVLDQDMGYALKWSVVQEAKQKFMDTLQEGTVIEVT